VNREFGHMSLIKDCLLNLWIDRDHKAFSKLDHILVIPLESYTWDLPLLVSV
jgi:hypothetical protein